MAESATSRSWLASADPRSRLLATQLVLLIAVSALPFLPSLRGGFVYDDEVQIVNNSPIHSWDDVSSYFTSTLFGRYDPTAASNFHYRPVFFLWLRTNDALWGNYATGWHIAALFLHLAVTVLLFLLLKLHFDDSWIALLAALLFGVHPAHVESVAWLSGATDPLAAAFLLASVLLWLRGNSGPKNPNRIGSVICFAAALLTKETAIVFPAIIFLYALWPLKAAEEPQGTAGKPIGRAFLAVLPYAVVVAAYWIARHAVLHGVPPQPRWLPVRDALLSGPLVLIFYLRHLVWPFGLTLFYSFPVVKSAGSPQFWLPLASVAVLMALVYFLWLRTEDSSIILATAWCILPLLPVLDIALFQQDDTFHDRYLYLPTIGLAIGVGLLLQYFSRRVAPGGRSRLAMGPAIAIILVFSFATVAEAAPWRNDFALYSRAVELSPKNTIARSDFAAELAKQNRLNEADAVFENVLADRPDYWLANYDFGWLNYRLARYDVSVHYLLRAIELNPYDPDEHAFLSLDYYHQDNLPGAVEELKKAIAIRPAGTGYHVTLAMVLVRMNDFAAARSECLEELAYHPENPAPRQEIAAIDRLLAKQGSTQK